MRAAVFLLVLVVLSATLVSETEAGWFRRSVRKAGKWIRENVRVRLVLRRNRRDAGQKALTALGCPLEEILHKYDCSVEGITAVSTDMEAALFDKSDVNKDNVLSDEEKKTFELMFLKEILAVCLEKRATAENLA